MEYSQDCISNNEDKDKQDVFGTKIKHFWLSEPNIPACPLLRDSDCPPQLL